MNVGNLRPPPLQNMKPEPPRITLANAKKGRLDVPVKLVGYGTDGVGKSTFASGAPSPFFITLDNRTSHLDIARSDPAPKTWDDMLAWVRVLETEAHEYKTCVVDPVNWAEPLVALKVTGDATIPLEKWDGGYGRGIAAATDRWRELIAALERLWLKGMHVIVLSHVQNKRFDDPQGPSYDRYEMALNAKAAGLFRQWADYVVFMKQESVAKLDTATKKFRGLGTGRHVAYTKWTAAYDAKWSGTAPDELPLSWDAFYEAVSSSRKMGDELRERIASLCKEIGDEAVSEKARKLTRDAGENHGKLEEIANALLIKFNEVQQTKEGQGS